MLVVASVAVDVTVSSVVSEVDIDAVLEETDEVAGDSATTACNKLVQSMVTASHTATTNAHYIFVLFQLCHKL